MKLCAISLRQSCFEVQLLIANVICKVFFTFLRRYWFFTFAFRSYIVLFLLILTLRVLDFPCSDSPIQPPSSQNPSAFAGQSFGPGGIQRLDEPSSTASIAFYASMLGCF